MAETYLYSMCGREQARGERVCACACVCVRACPSVRADCRVDVGGWKTYQLEL